MNAVSALNDCRFGKAFAGRSPEFEPSASEEFALRSLRILLVDDEPSFRDALAKWLEDDGHTVDTAIDGVEGFEKFCAGTWDIILVDRAMPRMNGFELAFAIKERNPHVPVVMVSGLPGLPAGADGFLSPVDVCVRKPFRAEHLRDSMIRAIQNCSAP